MSDATAIAAPLALVTGGCRRVGAVISQYLAKAGYSLALHGNSDAIPDINLQKTFDQTGVHWQGFTADLRQDKAAEILVKQVVEHFGHAPDIVINNASLFEYDDVDSMNSEMLNKHMAINFNAPVMLSKAVIEHQQDKQPCIIQILDQRISNPNPDQISYTLSKQALAQSIRTQAIAYGKRARINGIAPGFTLAPDDFSVEHEQRIADSMPLKRNSTADDIAQSILYLIQAQAVTGQIIYVDGGAHLKTYARDFEFM